jgi:hypothetical protein
MTETRYTPELADVILKRVAEGGLELTAKALVPRISKRA